MIAPESPPPTPTLFKTTQQPSKPLSSPRRLVRGSRRGPKAAAVGDRYITFDRIESPSPSTSSGRHLRPLPSIPSSSESSRPTTPPSPSPRRTSTRSAPLTLPSSLVASDPAIRKRRDRDAPVSPPGWRNRQSWKGPPLVRSANNSAVSLLIPLPPSPPRPSRSPHLSLKADGASLWSTSLSTDVFPSSPHSPALSSRSRSRATFSSDPVPPVPALFTTPEKSTRPDRILVPAMNDVFPPTPPPTASLSDGSSAYTPSLASSDSSTTVTSHPLSLPTVCAPPTLPSTIPLCFPPRPNAVYVVRSPTPSPLLTRDAIDAPWEDIEDEGDALDRMISAQRTRRQGRGDEEEQERRRLAIAASLVPSPSFVGPLCLDRRSGQYAPSRPKQTHNSAEFSVKSGLSVYEDARAELRSRASMDSVASASLRDEPTPWAPLRTSTRQKTREWVLDTMSKDGPAQDDQRPTSLLVKRQSPTSRIPTRPLSRISEPSPTAPRIPTQHTSLTHKVSRPHRASKRNSASIPPSFSFLDGPRLAPAVPDESTSQRTDSPTLSNASTCTSPRLGVRLASVFRKPSSKPARVAAAASFRTRHAELGISSTSITQPQTDVTLGRRRSVYQRAGSFEADRVAEPVAKVMPWRRNAGSILLGYNGLPVGATPGGTALVGKLVRFAEEEEDRLRYIATKWAGPGAVVSREEAGRYDTL